MRPGLKQMHAINGGNDLRNLEIDLQTIQDDLEIVTHHKHWLLKKVRVLTKRIDIIQREVSKAIVSLQECSAPNALWKVDKGVRPGYSGS
jgi:hypothetical protein